VFPLQILPGDAAIGPAYQDQQSPALARGGDLFLAVWADQRATGSGSDIYAARLDTAGNLLDAVPFVISQAPGDQVMPRAVWNGSDWLVIWQSQEPTEFYWASQAMGARVSAQGVVLDPTPIRVTSYQNSQSFIYGAASDGTNWLVVTEGSAAGEGDVLGFRISPAGILMDPAGIVILPETYYQRFGLEVAYAGDEYLFLWTEWNPARLDDVYAFRLTASVQKLDATPMVIAASTDYDVQPRAASDGTNFFVAYERYNACCGEGGRVFGTRVSHNGAVPDLAGLDISGNVGVTTGRHPCVVWDDANWCVAWSVPSISVARVSPAGVVLNPGGLPIDEGSVAIKEEPEIAQAPGGGARVVWTDHRAGGYNPRDIYSAAISAVGQPMAGACIALGAPSQLAPRLASSPNGYMAVFLSGVSGGQRVVAQRLDGGGNPLDVQPIQISPFGPDIFNPSVAGNGALYLVVWEDRGSSTVYGKRVRGDGIVLDAQPFMIMPGNTPDVVAIGDTFLVVDTHAPSNPETRFAYARRVRADDGALLDPAPVAVGGNFALIPRVAGVSDRWLVVWEGHPTHDDPVANVYGTFVHTDGTAAAQFAVTLDAYYVRFHNRPAVAANSTNALVLWSDPRFGNWDWGVFGRRVLPDGTVLDADGPPPAPLPPLTMPTTYPGFAITTAPNNQDHPAVVWDGSEYVAVWEDARSNTLFLDQRNDVLGASVSGAGVVMETNGIVLANASVPEISPAVAGTGGRTVLAVARFQDRSPFAAYRIGVRTMDNPSMVPPILLTTRVGPSLMLSWPTNTAGFRLEASPLTSGTLAWSPAQATTTLQGSNMTATIPMTGNGALYRLVRP